MKILITGNLGYLGGPVLRALSTSFPNAELIGYDTGYFAHCISTREPLPETILAAQYFGDIRTFPKKLIRGVDVVIHLAAISNDPIGNAFIDATDTINRVATRRLAQMAKYAGVSRFVFASSCSIYGFAEGGARDERDSLNPLSAYAQAKVAAEMDLRDLSEDSFAITSLRFATACGISDRLRLDLVLNDFVASARLLGDISVLSDGRPWRPLIHVDDMARAIEWAANRSAREGGAFLAINTGSNDWNFQIKDLANAVASVIPNVTVSINENAPPDKRSYQVNFSLFESLAPHHQPRVSLDDTIRALAKRLDSLLMLDGDFRSSDLVRLNVLKKLRAVGQLDEHLYWQSCPYAA